MVIAVSGYKGNIGSRLLKDYGYAPLICDVRQPKEVEVAINDLKPDLIVHLAGKSNVNWCERPENQEKVIQNNFRGSATLFEQADRKNIPVVYVSSDHIFSGNGVGNYKEDAKPAPKNYYGQSKLSVEALSHIYPNVRIIRTSTLFWKESQSVSKMLDSIRLGEDVHVPVYMWRSFLHIDHFCEMLVAYCASAILANPRVLNFSGSKVVSWYRFIVDYAKAQGLSTGRIHPKYFETEHNFAPRALRAGLNTSLSKRLGYTQYSYLDGITK